MSPKSSPSPLPSSSSSSSLLSSSYQRWIIICKKCLTINLQPTEENFPELPNVLIWIRFLIALLYGSYIGYYRPNERSFTVTIVQGINFIIFFPVMYCRMYLNIPATIYPTSIIFSGTINAIAFMILLWIYYYTKNHSYEETVLQSMLLLVEPADDTNNNNNNNNNNNDTISSSATATSTTTNNNGMSSFPDDQQEF